MDFTGELLPCLVNHRVFRCIYSMCVSNFAPSFIVVRCAFQPSFLFFSFLVIARLVSPFYGLKVSLALSLFARFFSFFLLDPPPSLLDLSFPALIHTSVLVVRSSRLVFGSVSSASRSIVFRRRRRTPIPPSHLSSWRSSVRVILALFRSPRPRGPCVVFPFLIILFDGIS